MGNRGPKPTPTKILKARGSWLAKTQPRADEPGAQDGIPTAPEFLTDEGRQFWVRLSKSIDHARLTSIDWRESMAAVCIAWDSLVHYYKKLVVYRDSKGCDIGELRRLQSMCHEAQSDLMRGLAVFGLTPADRSKITGAVRKEEKAEGGKGRFFEKRA